MKKTYKKPLLLIENFKVCHNYLITNCAISN